MGFWDFLTGSPAKRENVSTLRPEQEPLSRQAINAGMGRGAGGAFGTTADYYYGLVDETSDDYKNFAAPALRQYNEEIVPGLSEQFAGMGAGGLSSSGFRNAQVQGATDLSERLGALRAQLRQHGAQGLQQIGEIGLQNHSQNMETQAGSEGLLSSLAPAIGTAVGSFSAPVGAALGGMAVNWMKNSFGGNKVGKNSSEYQGGNNVSASPRWR